MKTLFENPEIINLLLLLNVCFQSCLIVMSHTFYGPASSRDKENKILLHIEQAWCWMGGIFCCGVAHLVLGVVVISDIIVVVAVLAY